MFQWARKPRSDLLRSHASSPIRAESNTNCVQYRHESVGITTLNVDPRQVDEADIGDIEVLGTHPL